MFTLQSQFFFPGTSTPVANGSVVVTLGSGFTIIATGGAAPTSYTFNFDSNGNLNNGQVYGAGELTPSGAVYTANIWSAANGGGTLVVGPITWIVGPSSPYAGTLYPDVTAIPDLSFSTNILDGVTVSGIPSAGQVLTATGTTTAHWATPPEYTVTSKTSNYTASSYDDVWCTGTFTVTLPAVSTTARVKISNRGTGQITVSPASGTIMGNASMILGTQFSSVELSSDGTNWQAE